MSTNDIRIGIIGAGVMGTDHATLLHESVKGATVSLIADMDAPKAAALAASVGANSLEDGIALINSSDVDAVIVASADMTHRDLVLAAIQANKPVLCEKPLATTAEQARDIVLAEDTTAGAGKLVSVGFMRRFDPTCVELHDAVVAKPHGETLLVHSISRGTNSGPGSTTRSALSNSAIHEIDYLPWLVGSPIAEVTWQAARQTKNASGLQDPQLFNLISANGVVSNCELFLNARYGHDVRFEVVFEEGTMQTVEPVNTAINANQAQGTTLGTDWRRRWRTAYRIELQNWVDGIRTGSPSPAFATARDGLASLLVVDALVASSENGGALTPVTQVADYLA
jgi:myo-inositol 2-dehydrogenase/D-chiro-inositol 1-dehydrogenase